MFHRLLLIDGERLIYADLILYDEAIDDNNMVFLEINFEGEKISFKGENFFQALLDLRRELEKNEIQIICNGAAKNVYPSRMQLSMGTGIKAYKMYIGKQAKMSDVVNIFDCDEELDFVKIEEQSNFYDEWLRSLRG